jgi:hypothetical protein
MTDLKPLTNIHKKTNILTIKIAEKTIKNIPGM